MRRRSPVRLCSMPERNRPVLVGPQSVMSIGPEGKPWRSKKERWVGTTFHAPVDR